MPQNNLEDFSVGEKVILCEYVNSSHAGEKAEIKFLGSNWGHSIVKLEFGSGETTRFGINHIKKI